MTIPNFPTRKKRLTAFDDHDSLESVRRTVGAQRTLIAQWRGAIEQNRATMGEDIYNRNMVRLDRKLAMVEQLDAWLKDYRAI